ncbi:hypothetical protein ABIA33_007223 [Streptacidiphilus sp. MAP12-16]
MDHFGRTCLPSSGIGRSLAVRPAVADYRVNVIIHPERGRATGERAEGAS